MKLSKDKRDKIIAIAAGGLVLAGLIWFTVIGAQRKAMKELVAKSAELDNKIEQADRRIRSAKFIREELNELRGQLRQQEGQMIPREQLTGSLWIYNKLSQYCGPKYNLALSDLSLDAALGDKYVLFPEFPYNGAAYTAVVRGHYHEFGKFLADWENNFPFMSIHGIEVVPAALQRARATPGAEEGGISPLAPGEIEKLVIKIQIVVLYKPPEAA